jgi:hypothetical protein
MKTGLATGRRVQKLAQRYEIIDKGKFSLSDAAQDR